MANTGAKFIITEIKGEAYVRKETGETVKLNVGDLLEEGDVLLTGDGEVTLEDQAGAVLTIPANSTFILPGALPPVLSGSEGQETGGEEAGSEGLAPGEAASQSQAQTSQPQSSSGGEGGDASSGGGSSFFNAPRTDYLQDNRFVDQGNLNRDINDVFDFMGRHTENPRIHYQFDLDRVKFPLYGPDEYERGGGRRDDYTPPIEEHKEDRSDDVRFELAPDQNSVKEDGPLTASGSVLDNDRGRELKVVGVMKQGDPGSPSSGNVGNEVTGEYGTVKINADGSYVYELNNSDARVQALAEGEKFTETFVYSATDKRGETQTTTLTITIHGTNDAPEIRLLEGNSDSAGLTETDEPLTASGTLTPFDVDTSDTVTADKTGDLEIGGSFAGKLPEGFDAEKFLSMFEVGGPGEPSTTDQENPHGITWTFNSGGEAFNFLPAGETITLTYTVEATDSHGAKTTHPVTITITGTNDAPVAAPDAEAISKNDPSAGGNVLVNDHDPDQGDEIKVVGVTKGKEDTAGGNVGAGVPGEYGTIIINEDGSYTYTPNGGDPRVSGLKDGEKLEDIFTYTISDGKGGTSTTTVTITINGENNPPVARPDTGFTPRDETAAGNVLENDSDPEGDKITVTGITSEKDPEGGLDKPVEGEYGQITIDEYGNYTYTPDPDNPAVKNMGEGETLQDIFTYTIVDEDGKTSTTTVTITIGGPGNHPPVAHPDENSVSEDGPSVQGNVITGGTPGDKADVDPDGDLLEVIGVAKGDTGTANGNVGSEIPGEYGRIIINPDGSYTYTPNSGDPRVNGLEDGEKLEDVFTYTISDGNGGTSTTTVTITINGVNDDPVARPDENTVGRGGADQAGYEDGNPDTTVIASNVTVNDSDPEGKTLIVTGVGTEINPAGNVGAEVKGQYGTVIIHEDGSYTYILDNGNAAVDAMGEDDTLEDVFTYAISDGQGGADQTTLKIIITGTAVPNLPPVAEPDKGTVSEDGPPAEGNVLENDHDPEGDPIKVVGVEKGDGGTPVTDGSGVGTEVPGEYGKITIDEDGNYTYTPNSGDPRVNGLDEGETLEDTFTYTIVDEDGRTSTTTVTITITGTNDGPVAQPDTNTVPEDGPAAVGNVLPNDSDPEGDPLTVVGVEKGNTGTQITDGSGVSGTGVTGQYGTVVIHPDGSYSYTPNREVTNSLADGEEVKDVFTYTISDGKGGYAHTTLTITITGTNDDPTANPDVNTVREGAPDHPDHEDNNPDTTIIVGNVTDNDTDPDIGDTLTVIGVQKGEHASPFTGATTVTGDYGEVTINPDGSYTYALDNTNLAVKALGKGETLTETFTYTVKDEQGATAFTTLTITIKGPLVIPDINEVTEDAADAAGHEDGLPETTIIAGDVIANDKGVGLEVTGVRAGDDAENPAVGNVSVEVQGTYGKVVINHDGTYTYALDNANEDVDALAVGETLTETFVYTASDGTETSNTTLTITIHGANDAPVIGCKTEEYGNKEEETIQDYSEDLVTGTLYVGDVDNNDVVTVDISKVVNTGYDLKFDETQLKGLFTFDNDTVLGKDDYFDQKGITWTFTSGGLNFIPDGQTATLVYTVTVTDKEGATASHDVTINITGNDDTGSLPHSLTKTIPEDQHNETPLSGDLFKEPGYEDDPDEGQTVRIKSYTIEGMGSQQGATGGFIVGTEHAVYTAGGKIGKITINADGTYDFYTEKDYSGELKINYEGESGSDEKGWTDITGRTLTIKVTPVADAPEINEPKPSTYEDVPISLGLKIPEITDLTDLTGPGDDHDNPERLGLITLEFKNFLEGAKLFLGKEGEDGFEDLTSHLQGEDTTKTIKIKLTDTENDDYHIKEIKGLVVSGDGVIELTKAQYESLQIQQAEHHHENIDVTVKATSYEVNNEGVPLGDDNSVYAATTTVDFTVDVKAVTDPIKSFKINGTNEYTYAAYEDTEFSLSDLLATDFDDLDASENRWIEISADAAKLQNITVKVNGNTISMEDGVYKIPCPGLSTPAKNFPDITIGSIKDFSGIIEGLTITLKAQDTDSDSTHTTEVLEKSVTLSMDIRPVADDIVFNDATTNEDTAVKFLGGLALTDIDGSEEFTKILLLKDNIPAGWTIKDHAGQIVVDKDGNLGSGVTTETIGVDTYIVINHGKTGNTYNYKNYTTLPPSHSSLDWANVTIKAETKDTAGIHFVTREFTETADVVVKPVAERIADPSNPYYDTDGDNLADLTMTPGKDYTTPATEDIPYALNQDGFVFSAGWTNQDPSEKTFALLSPEVWDHTKGAFVAATGAKFTWTGGSATFDGSNPVEIPIEHLDSVEFTPPPNLAGEFKIKVQAKTEDYDEDHLGVIGKADIAVSGEAILQNLIVNPVADKVTVAISQAAGKEDEAIKLDIRPSSEDPNETFNVTILKSHIPAGAKFTYGGVEIDPEAASGMYAGGKVEITADGVKFIDYKAGLLSITPPLNSDVDFTLKVQTVAVDTVHTQSGTITAETPIGQVATLDLLVKVESVADGATLTVQNHTVTEADAEANKITLDKVITGQIMTDTDGSEKLSLVVTGLKSEFSLEGTGVTFLGGADAGRKWSVAVDNPANLDTVLKGIYVKTPNNFNGKIDLTAQAVTTEIENGDAKVSAEYNSVITVIPTPEAGMNLTSSGNEDAKVQLNFGVIQKNGETDEYVNEVWIKATGENSVGSKGVTLYKGGTELTVIEDGWFKIAKADLGNIYAQGPANKGGNYTFDVRYFAGDKGLEGNADVVDIDGVDKTYTLNLTPVTDATTTAVQNLQAGANSAVNGDTVTISKFTSGEATFTIDVRVTQQNDTNSIDGGSDKDGSEKLTRLVIDGVPEGVMIDGGTYIGNVEEGGFNGRWMVPVGEDFNAESLTKTLTFRVDSSSSILATAGTYNLTVTAFSWDEGAPSGTSSKSGTWHIEMPEDSVVENPTPPEYTLAEVSVVQKANPDATEDQEVSLGDLAYFTITGSNLDPNQPFSITLNGLPDGASVKGMVLTQTEKDGQTVWTWTASGSGGQAALQALVDGIKITMPENWNDNPDNPGQGFVFETTITAYSKSGGEPNSNDATINPTIKPVTDPTNIDITAPDVNEGDNAAITIKLSNAADDPNSNIVDGKLYVRITEPGAAGTLSSNKGTLSKVDDYFVIEGVNQGDTVELTYTPDPHTSGSFTVQSWVVSQETGADNTVTSTGTENFTINPVNSGYSFEGGPGAATASGVEDALILLTGGGGLVDTDGSEKIVSATLSNVPEGFIVYTCNADGSNPVMASNAGGGTWSVPLGAGGSLPAKIGLKAPENWSGVESGIKLNVFTAEEGFSPIATTKEFTVEVNPEADGIEINPTQTFGNAGTLIPINLNATMEDTDGSETVTLKITGLGEGAVFFVEDRDLQATYENETYTMSGIAHGELGKLYLAYGETFKNNITVKAQTVDEGAGQTDYSAFTEDKSFALTINPAVGTDNDDTMVYFSGLELDGKGGEDTLVFRYGETVDFSAAGVADNIKNFEIFDLAGNGAQSLENLSVAHVMAMTDSNNTLTINGDLGDSVSLVTGDWTLDSTSGGYNIYTGDGATLKIADAITVDQSGSLAGFGGGVGKMMAMSAFGFDPEEGESEGQGGYSAPYEPFAESGESGSGGQEWDSSSPSSQDDEGASHGSDWDAASGNSGSGNSGDDSHTGSHDGSSELGAGSDVIPIGSGPETSSGGDSGPEDQGGLDEALEGISADDVLDTGGDELPLPGGGEGDGLGSVPDTGGADIPEFYAPDVPDSAARIAEEMEDAISA